MQLAKAQPLPVGPAVSTPFQPVASSWISGLRWTPEYGAEMTTKGGKRSYPYPGITKAMFREWLSRASKGTWWHRHVREAAAQFSRWTGPVHPLFTPAADGPIDFGSFTQRDKILGWMKSRISPHATPEHLAALAGWLPGTKFHAYFSNKQPGQNVGDTLNTEVSDPHGQYVAHRTIDLHGNTRPALTNEIMHIPTDGTSPYRGASGPVLLRQMRAAYEMGVPAINFFAAYDPTPEHRETTVRPGLQAMFPGHDLTALLGPPQGQQQRFTGGLHWPLMGVDGILPGRYIKSIPREIVDSAQLHSRGAFLGSQKISDFFRSPEARDYYLGHPTSHEAMIDTTPGSYSRQQIERHVAEKAMKHGLAAPIPDTMMPKKPLHLSHRRRHPFHVEHLIATGSLHPDFFDHYFNHYDPRQ